MHKLLRHSRRPDISFSRNGLIRISARVAAILSLRPGDAINISVLDSEGRQPEYMLHAVRCSGASGRYEAQCYATKKGSRSLRANSVRLCCAMLDIAGTMAADAAFFVGQPVARDGRVLLPVITKCPL